MLSRLRRTRFAHPEVSMQSDEYGFLLRFSVRAEGVTIP